jgi:UDP-N-acetylmuramate--alanine ligase
LHFGLPGRHNLMNALMAIAMAKVIRNRCYCKSHCIIRIKRRFSYQIKTDVKVYIDDYAHQQSNAVHQAVRELSKSKVLAIFSLICLVEREILLMILPKVYRPLMKSFYGYLSCT